MKSFGQLSKPEREEIVRRLLAHLARGDHAGDGAWQGWRIERITGGRNNLLYRASGPIGDLAIKFTRHDERDRAGREFNALSALRQAGLSIAPEPILLDRERYAQPVVVQSWLEGEVHTTPPATDGDWQKVVDHLVSVHTVTPETTSLRLRPTTIHASNVEEGKQLVRQQLAQLPLPAQPPALQRLARRLEAAQFAEWQRTPVTLCRLDNNISNYVRRPGPWASVDWEYSGWGDPAFDVANIVTHVALVGVAPARWQWFVGSYCRQVADATAALRIGVYCEIMLVWWVARLARYLYELPRGLDQRLADWPDGWQTDIQAKYEHYLRLAEAIYL